MNEYKDEFKKSYQEGRTDTRKEIQGLRAGKEMSHASFRTLAKYLLWVSALITLFAFFYSWHVFGLLLALGIAVAAWLVSILFGIAFICLLAPVLRR